jgi:hypothetical protein
MQYINRSLMQFDSQCERHAHSGVGGGSTRTSTFACRSSHSRCRFLPFKYRV